MSSFINRIRSGAGKAAFEADKLRRVNAVQSKIKSLKTSVEKTYYQVGYVAFTLYHNGRVNQPELKEACERLAAIQTQIAAQEQEIERIRAETYVEPQFGLQYGRVCPKGHGPIPLPNNFCQVCGAPAVETQPPAPEVTAYCQNCGTALTPGVRFCSHCGQTASEPAPPPAPTAPSGSCPVCGTSLLPGAVFCAECGHKVSADAAVSPTELPSAPSIPGTEDEVSVTPSPEPAVCPDCQAPLLPGAVFCAECGHHLTSDAGAALETVDMETAVFPAETSELPEADTDITETVAYPAEESPIPETGMPEVSLEAILPEEPELDTDEADSMAVIPEADTAEGAPDTMFEQSVIEADEPGDDSDALSNADGMDVCPVCDEPLLSEAIFCAECGHRVTQNEE